MELFNQREDHILVKVYLPVAISLWDRATVTTLQVLPTVMNGQEWASQNSSGRM